MTLSLSLTRSELQALAVICNAFVKPHYLDGDFIVFCYISSLEDLLLSLLLKSRVPRKKYRMTLKDMQILALRNLLSQFADKFQPFEQAFAHELLAKIDQEHQSEVTLLKSIKK
ncbi:MAG: hypothetical protein LBH92_03960 [Bacteroidales bacterium]|jgi:hypothetical protein|nr:hypothetical protein [Bacteroidales bacterium]